MTSEPILNQPWEDVADDVTGAIEKAVQPLLKKAVDDIYGGLLDATQDYLKDNLAFNIASRIATAEREAASARQRADNLAFILKRLVGEVEDLAKQSAGVAGLHHNGDIADWDWLVGNGGWLSSLDDAREAAQ